MYAILYPFMVICSVAITLLTYALAPLLALFVRSDGNLPKRLYWFQTFDATCFEGRQPQYGFTGSDWWVATRWLWRNPAYGFDYWPLGIAFDPKHWRMVREDEWFIAFGPYGQFCIEHGGSFSLKLGWKAKNYRENGAWITRSWGPDYRAPLCFTP